MEALNNIVGAINGVVWGWPMLILILGVGLFLQVFLKFMPILRVGIGFKLLFEGRENQGEGQISPFNALMTSLSATIGTGNIAGVATAVFLGGPGALFWMWMTSTVILGGISRIGAVAGKLVPFMAVSYILAGLLVLLINASEIGNAVSMVFTYAFTPSAATGGFAGAAVMAAIRFGVARGVFSNEAGLGSAPIAHAAASNNSPVNQGLIAMLGTFIDTIIVCSITGLAIISSGAWTSGESGAALTSLAFETSLPGIGGSLIAISLSIFAFTTILGWSFYGEKCMGFFFDAKALMPYRVLWIVTIYFGATADLGFIWLLADTLNAMMAIPNLIALALLSPVVAKLTKEYFAERGASEPAE
jgi:AGCS family alanine or glycine:cation symporter